MRTLSLLMAFAPLFAAELELSRPVHTWEYLDATGPRAAFFGKEDGTLEAYVYPMKIFKDLRLRFRLGSRVIPGESIVRTMRSRPGSYTLTYAGDEFQVEQTIAASTTEPGLIMHLAVHSYEPLTIEGEFTRDFQPMWPAAIGSSYAEWNQKSNAWFFGADGQPFAAVFGGPELALKDAEYATNYSAETTDRFTLGSVNGRGERWLAIAGSVHSRDEAMAAWRRLIADPAHVISDADRFYADYLKRTVSLELPDSNIQQAYDWARISMVKGMVDNPLLGRGLVAGYGLSKGAYRPGFAWFFGRDSFWTSFALTAAGDFDSARTAIEFVAKYQRDDGKIPHEISQSASLLPWFKDYPYGYASADATPLFVIAVRDYVDNSGDIEFARKHWAQLNKAFDFMRSTLGAGGYPKNFGVGHGWVEGGPLLPVQVELYQAGCYVEALRSMAKLARLTGETDRSVSLQREFDDKRRALDDLFWIVKDGTYAFALDNQGKPVDQPSVLATVAMWFGVLDPAKSRRMVETLAHEAHEPDWGMRIIGSDSPTFGPSGYHYGSVWPLFTGWASVGEYRYHMAAPAFANLRANVWLTLAGAGGNTTEVLSGATYSPLSTSSPHQTWSSAMVVSPILRGMLGLAAEADANRVTFAPHLPASWNRVVAKNVRVGAGSLELALIRSATRDELTVVNSGADAVQLAFAPAYSPPTEIKRVTVNGAAVPWQTERNETDWHPQIGMRINPGRNVLIVERTELFGYTVEWRPPTLGQESQNLKIVSERWTPDALELRVSGLPGRDYRITVTDGREVPIKIAGSGNAYRDETIRIPLRAAGR
jgi:glycogen debranching enzyme